MMMSMVMLVTDDNWYLVMQKAQLWLEENKWDIKVSRTPKKCDYSIYLYDSGDPCSMESGGGGQVPHSGGVQRHAFSHGAPHPFFGDVIGYKAV